nr:MAG TPA: hypothetical protein [Caudoviricetes sp.]
MDRLRRRNSGKGCLYCQRQNCVKTRKVHVVTLLLE